MAEKGDTVDPNTPTGIENEEDCDNFKSMDLEEHVQGEQLLNIIDDTRPLDRRNSLLDKFDPLATPNCQKRQPPSVIIESDDLVNPKMIELELVQEESNQHTDLNGHVSSEEQVLTGGDEAGSRLDVTFTLVEGDSLTTENYYSLEPNQNQDHIDTCQDRESHHHKETQVLKAKVAELEATLAKNSNLNGNHALLVTEYEAKLGAMTDSAEDWKARAMALDRDKIVLIRERDQAREDLHNVEAAFSDVHRKYERVKEVLKNNNQNQKLLESRDLELQERLKLANAHISELEDEYKDKLSSVYSSFEARLKNQEVEATRLRAQLRKLQMKNETLENDVKQKTSEVAKLSSLCDELINKV